MRKVQVVNGSIFCIGCKTNKSTIDFYEHKDSFKRPCKACKLKYQKDYYADNSLSIEEYRKAYYKANRYSILEKQSIRDYNRKYIIKTYQASYRQKNKYILAPKRRAYIKDKLLDPTFKLRRIVSNAIYQAIKSNKDGSILNHLDYSIQELKEHIQSQFEPWMNWNNHGIYKNWDDNDPSTWTWQIDHIITQAALPYSSMSDPNFKACWNLNNLRPYSAKQNNLDGNRIISEK